MKISLVGDFANESEISFKLRVIRAQDTRSKLDQPIAQIPHRIQRFPTFEAGQCRPTRQLQLCSRELPEFGEEPGPAREDEVLVSFEAWPVSGTSNSHRVPAEHTLGTQSQIHTWLGAGRLL